MNSEHYILFGMALMALSIVIFPGVYARFSKRTNQLMLGTDLGMSKVRPGFIRAIGVVILLIVLSFAVELGF